MENKRGRRGLDWGKSHTAAFDPSPFSLARSYVEPLKASCEDIERDSIEENHTILTEVQIGDLSTAHWNLQVGPCCDLFGANDTFSLQYSPLVVMTCHNATMRLSRREMSSPDH